MSEHAAVDYRDRPDLPSYMTLRELRLLHAFAERLVVTGGHDEEAQIGVHVRDRGRNGNAILAPWVEFSVEDRRLGIWRNTLKVYEADEHGAMGEEPLDA